MSRTRLILSEDQFKDVMEVLRMRYKRMNDMTLIGSLDTTEKWCQERAIYLSLMESVKIADGQDEKRDKGCYTTNILSDALGVSFDDM